MPCKDMTGREHCCREGGAGNLVLPSGVDAHTIEASFENGALEVRLPRADKAKEKTAAIAAG